MSIWLLLILSLSFMQATSGICPTRGNFTLRAGPLKFMSQASQDRFVLKLLKGKTNGFYVDLAANDPICLSNTYALEKWFGWHGLCIEGNPDYIPLLKSQRNCTVIHTAVDMFAGQQVQFRKDKEFGGIVANYTRVTAGGTDRDMINLTTRMLGEILDTECSPTVIDYFSLDVEGAELRVMQAFPFKRYKFRIITIERPPPELKEILRRSGYVFLKGLIALDEVWVHQDFLNEGGKELEAEADTFRPRGFRWSQDSCRKQRAYARGDV